jgi:5'(3')-deoxyribonucleotidase
MTEFTSTPYNTNARKIFIDLDGVTANFDAGRRASGMLSAQFKRVPGSYRNLAPYPEALVSIRALIARGFDVWIATKIPTKAPWAATEKLFWIKEHLPELERSVIITPNKGTLGTSKDFLIDDRPHKAHCEEFQGHLLRYGPTNEFKDWNQVMEFFSLRSPNGIIVRDLMVGNTVIPVKRNAGGEYVYPEDLPIRVLPHQISMCYNHSIITKEVLTKIINDIHKDSEL